VRFLIDTNLPKSLCRWIASKGHEAEHVLDLGLGQADDADIWVQAQATGAVVISKDEDFPDMVRLGSAGPSVVWIRTGNGTTRQLLTYLETLWPHVEARLGMGDRLVEVR
jgi:predicted nuclease of predicted toxin-antitoxin system